MMSSRQAVKRRKETNRRQLGTVGFAVFFCGLFVAVAAIVGDVKTRPLEEQSRAAADQTLDFAFATFRAFPDGFGRDRLKRFKGMTAVATGVFIRRHNKNPLV